MYFKELKVKKTILDDIYYNNNNRYCISKNIYL